MSQIGQHSDGTTFTGIQSITGNSGGAVFGSVGFNVDLVGSGDLTVVGNPGANTLTIMLSDALANQFDTDSGSAIPVNSILNIIGGAGITTAGSGDTITITGTVSTLKNYTAVNSSPYPASASDEYLGVDCSGGAITIQLPNTPSTGRYYTIKDSTGSAASFNITLQTVSGTGNIDGSTSYALNTNYQAVNVIYNGSAYEIF